MALAVKIAWRNLLRHRGRSLFVGSILFTGALVLTTGNAVISGMERGMERNIIDRFTGHIVLVSTNTKTDNILYSMTGDNLAEMTGFDKIRPLLDTSPLVEKYLPAARGVPWMLDPDGDGDGMIVFGVDFEKYQAMFRTNVRIVEGRPFAQGERGILVNANDRNNWYRLLGIWVSPPVEAGLPASLPPELARNPDLAATRLRTSVALLGLGDRETASDISVPVRGVMEYASLNELWGFIELIDLDSFRECFGYATGETGEPPDAATRALLASDTAALDLSVGGEAMFVSAGTGAVPDAEALRRETVRTTSVPRVSRDEGYNLVFVRLKPDLDPAASRDTLNAAFRARGADARAVTWKAAVGTIAELSTIMKAVLAGLSFVFFIVAGIIIMNALAMSAVERSAELGMMRAIGAHKGFVSAMFFAEVGVLAGIFGGAGTLAGAALATLASALDITSDNGFLQLLFGGNTFRPHLAAGDLAITLFELALATVLAWLYPARIARRIVPLDALQRE